MAQDQEHNPDPMPNAPSPPGEAPPTPAPAGPEPRMHVAPSPHVSDQAVTTRRMMTDVLLALTPLMVVALAVFRWYAVIQVGLCVLSCLAAEALFTWLRRKPLSLGDCSAVITGVILAFSLPAVAPWYVGVIGSFVAIGLGKIVFGGLGMNIFNPAMVGRAFVMMAFVGVMAGPAYVWYGKSAPAAPILTRATPMSEMKEAKVHPSPTVEAVRAKAVAAAAAEIVEAFGVPQAEARTKIALALDAPRRDTEPSDIAAIRAKIDAARRADTAHREALNLGRLMLGNTNGSLGEVSALACLIGGIFLCVRRTAAWRIPLGAVAAVVVIGWLGDLLVGSEMTMLHHLLGGAFLFGALFIATDPVTSPLTPNGRLIFGVIFGALVMLLRNLSAYPEGVMFAILLVNALAPLINRWTVPTPVGGPVPQKK